MCKNNGPSRGHKKSLGSLELSSEPLCGCWELNSLPSVLCETANTPNHGAFSAVPRPLPLLL